MNIQTRLRSQWDRILGTSLLVIGFISLIVTLVGVRDSLFVADQVSFVASGGLLGVCLVAVGVGLLISADLHDEWRKLDRIESALRGEDELDVSELLEPQPREGAINGPAGRAPGRPTGTVPATVGAGSNVGRASGANGAFASALDWPSERSLRSLSVMVPPLVLSTAVMVVGWHKSSQAVDLDPAAKGLGVALAGLLLFVAVVALGNLVVRARIARREGRVLGAALTGVIAMRPKRATSTASGRRDDATVVVVAGLRRYHRPGCAALAGMVVTTVARRELDAGLRACGLCDA